MQRKLSKLQKVCLVCIGVLSNNENKTYVKRRKISKKLIDIISISDDEYEKKKFSVTLTNSIKSLVKRELITKRGTYVGLTKDGKKQAREIISEIKSIYNIINWKVIGEYYEH